MSELISVKAVKIGNEEIPTVDARKLHSFLEVGKDFSTWINDRIVTFDFVENQDYVVIPEIGGNPKGGRPSKEHHISLDMAKELSMVERNEKGKYFIECEKRLKKVFVLPDFTNPAVAARAWADECEQKMLAEAKVKELTPKAEFFDAVTGSTDAVDIGTAAKVLNMGIGRNTMFEILRDEGILMPGNQPYQKHIDSGYFRVIEQKYTKPDGSTHISLKTVVFQKGLDFIRKIMLKKVEVI